MRAVVARSLLVVGAGAAVLAVVLYVASTVDARPPEVLAIRITQPVGDEAELALITTSIEVEFSEPVETDSAEAALRIEPAVPGSASWSGSTLIFTPDEPLELEAAYEVRVEPGVVDRAGNRMSDPSDGFAFRTAGRPTVAEAEPADGAEDVPVDGPLVLVFSTLMDTASVEQALRIEPAIAHELRWSGERLEIVPLEPLAPDETYTISIGQDAADIAGVAIGEPVRIGFRTVVPGLAVEALVPADGSDGIAPATAIAILFDRTVDPASVDEEQLVIEPEVAGTLEVVGHPEAEPGGEGTPMLRFTPSGPLPPNTTFEVSLHPGAATPGGGALAEVLTWSFTTGPPPAAISNQVTFLTDRSGVVNLWAMNPDGTGQRQISAELAPILDYAVASDGSAVVVADGRRLVYLRTDGSERQLLTDAAHWDFDPTFAPDAQRLAFARADAETGAGLGLWEWTVGGGEPQPIRLPDGGGDDASPSPSRADAPVLRTPRYAPDGQALAFVDVSGMVGILELPAARLTRVRFAASGPPAWLPGSEGVLLTGSLDPPAGDPPRLEAPVAPLEPGPPGATSATYRLGRSALAPADTALGEAWRVLSIAADGSIAAVTDRGWLGISAGHDDVDDLPRIGERVIDAAFAPGEAAIVVVVAGTDGPGGRIERIELDTERRETLVDRGWRPRWLP